MCGLIKKNAVTDYIIITFMPARITVFMSWINVSRLIKKATFHIRDLQKKKNYATKNVNVNLLLNIE